MDPVELATREWEDRAWRAIVRAILDGVQGVLWLLIFVYPDVQAVSGTCAVLALAMAMYLVYSKGFDHARMIGKKAVPWLEMIEGVSAIGAFVVVMTMDDPLWIAWFPAFPLAIIDIYHPASWFIESAGASNLKRELANREGWIAMAAEDIAANG